LTFSMILVSIIVFVVILTVLVFFHELGHFFTARKFGIKVEEFGLGLPPRIFGLRRRTGGRGWEFVWGGKVKATASPSTIYSLNWLPIGGFVKIKGEQGEGHGEVDSFVTKTAGRRSLILAAGVLMNAVLTVVLLTLVFGIGFRAAVDPDNLPKSAKDLRVTVQEVLPDTPAAAAGLQISDNILAIDDVAITTIDEMTKYLSGRQGTEVTVTIERGVDILVEMITPQMLDRIGTAGIGVALTATADVALPWPEAIWQGVLSTGILVVAIFKALGQIIGDLISVGHVTQDIAGPVGIAVLTKQAVSLGIVQVLQFAALLSINLAILNILPFPALDGGRLLFIVMEKLRGRPIAQKVENVTHTVGFALLIGLIILITFRDISIFGQGILNTLKGIF
jgi:regulator of sigma E protease